MLMSPKVRPVRGLRWFPDATFSAVRPVALSQPGGLLYLTAHGKDHLHCFHGHHLVHLHGPQHGRTGLSDRQGRQVQGQGGEIFLFSRLICL